MLQYNNVLIYAEIDRICLSQCKELGECFKVYVEGTWYCTLVNISASTEEASYT